MYKLSILLFLTAGSTLFGSTPGRSTLPASAAYTQAIGWNDSCQETAGTCASSLVWGTAYRSIDRVLAAPELAGSGQTRTTLADSSESAERPAVQPGSVVWGTSPIWKWLHGLG